MINAASPASVRIGIDLGGTKTEVIALAADGRTLLRHREPTPAGDYEQILRLIVALVDKARAVAGTHASVGIGTPGALSHLTGAIKNANSTCLNGRQFKRDIEARLGQEVRIANDANCFALSEAMDGAGKDMACVFGVILGTGVGGGVVMHGKVLTGANAIAGEWGHNPLPLPREADLPLPACYCGRSGCIETYLCGPALARDHLAHAGVDLDAVGIARGAMAGDAACEASLSRYEERLARSLASVINVIDPDVIVLGGGLSAIGRLYENVPRLWTRQVFSDHVATRLVRNVHGDSSGVRGAAWLWGPSP